MKIQELQDKLHSTSSKFHKDKRDHSHGYQMNNSKSLASIKPQFIQPAERDYS